MKHTAVALRNTVILCVIAAACGCATSSAYHAPLRPPSGFLFTSVTVPLQVSVDATPVDGLKSGSGRALYFRDIIFTGMDFAFGDCSVKEAAYDGRIDKVHFVDYMPSIGDSWNLIIT